jgi:hypothetical protein
MLLTSTSERQSFLNDIMSKKRVFEEENAEVEPVAPAPKASKKPLPPGYVCKACGMKDDHAIYNCTLAIKKPKAEKVADKTVDEPEAKVEKAVEKAVEKPKFTASSAASKTDGATATETAATNEDMPLTVFISGLPFKINRTKVIDIFQKEGFASDITGKEVKLVMFEDKPEKCRGLAYVTFKSEEDYKKGLALNGQQMDGRTLQIVPCAPFSKNDGGKANVKGAFKGRAKLPEGVVKIPRCYRCGQLHEAAQCNNPRICYKCKSTEHLSSQCPMKKPKA